MRHAGLMNRGILRRSNGWRKLLALLHLLLGFLSLNKLQAQDSTMIIDEKRFTLSEVVVRNNLDYKMLLDRIKADTSFYKAFKTLRILGFSSYNNIQMTDKKGKVVASMQSKTRQNHEVQVRSHVL